MNGDGGRKLVESMFKVVERSKGQPVDIVLGEVKQITPSLIVEVGKLRLTEKFLIQSPFCIEKSSEYNSLVIPIWRGLQIGDNVLMLRCGDGQTYYILQRQEGATL